MAVAIEKMKIEALAACLPGGAVRTDAESLAKYGRDWVRLREPRPAAVVFPADTEETVRVVQWARKYKVPLVPSGGRTGLCGGALADAGQVVLSAERMNKILGVSPIDRTLTAQAGVTIGAVQEEAKRVGLKYPIDFAPIDTMQLGGNIATNAGGVHVVRYGMTRNWVAGLTIVTGTAEVLDLSLAVLKNNTGYDLKQLFIGSEGTLGIITEATVRLAVPPAASSVALLCVPDLASVSRCGDESRRHGELLALEFWDDAGMELALDHLKRGRSVERSAWYVLGEFEGAGTATAWAQACIERRLARGSVVAAPEGMPAGARPAPRDLWEIRLSIGTAVAPFTPYKNDISIPVTAMPSFLPALTDMLRQRRIEARLVVWGHLADGNLHVNCLKPETLPAAEFEQVCRSVDEGVYALVASHGGSISAEHGIGLLKKHALHHSRSAVEIEAMRGIKRLFDPDQIMNPGKIFD